MVNPELARLELRLELDSADADQIDSEIRQLSAELRDMGLSAAQRPTESPSGAKSGNGFILGSLLVDVLPNAISPLIDFLNSWTRRREGRILKIKVSLEGRSVELEFDPQTTSLAQARALVNSILRELNRAKE